MSLKFYEVDRNYIKFLKEHGDSKIPNIEYGLHKKFFCGIVFTVNNFNYFVHVSSYNKKLSTSFLIKEIDKDTKQLKAISSLRFSFMFPCPIEYLNQIDFSKEDEKYWNLLRKELHYCNINREKISKLAKQIYKLGLSEKYRNLFNICNFKRLEEKCMEYIELNKK